MGAKKAREIALWAQEEMATVQLNHKRLDARLTALLSALGDPPAASIPAACGGYAERTAAYRFFDNRKITFAKILEPHFAALCQSPALSVLIDGFWGSRAGTGHAQVFHNGHLRGA